MTSIRGRVLAHALCARSCFRGDCTTGDYLLFVDGRPTENVAARVAAGGKESNMIGDISPSHGGASPQETALY